MSSPTSLSLPPGPGASSAARSGGPGRAAADRGTPEAFGSALKDALAGTGTPSRPATGRAEETPDDVAAEAPAGPAPEEQPDAGTPPLADLPPGIWALLNGTIGPAAPAAASTPVTGSPTGVVPPGQPVGTAPVLASRALPSPGSPDADAPPPATAPVPAGPPTGHTAPVTQHVRGASADALAQAAGLTVVAARAGGDGPAPAAVPTAAPVPAAPPPRAADGDAAAGNPAPATPTTAGTTLVAGGDADGAGPGTDDGSGPSAGPAPGPGPADDLASSPPGPASPAATPTAPPVVAGPAAARETPVAAQLAPQLAVLRNSPDGSQTMTVVLTPDSLGEVTVQVTITDGTLDLMLRGGSEHGRHALADALPELRRELEGAGLSFSRLAVDPDAPRDSGQGNRTAEQLLADMRGNGGHQQRHDSPRSRAWVSTGAPLGESGPAPTAHSSASTGVDVRV